MTLEALRRWRDETGDATGLGLVRIAMGLLLLQGVLRVRGDLGSMGYEDVFHWSTLPEALVPSHDLALVLLGAQIVLSVLVILGLRAGEALLATAILGTYLMLCNRLHFHHNRWALLCLAALLSFTPCDRSLRLGRSSASAVGPLWGARLARLQVSVIYLSSSGSKLFDPDWRGGLVLLERLHIHAPEALAAGVPASLLSWLSTPLVASLLAKGAITTELFLAVGLWLRPSRWIALVVGIGFHAVIEITSHVEGFSWLMLASYGLFFLPELGALITAVKSRLRRQIS